MEIVAHECAEGTMISMGDRRCSRQGRSSIAGQSVQILDRPHNPRHFACFRFPEIDCGLREQMRPRLDESRAEVGVSNLMFQYRAKRGTVERDTEALLVQALGKRWDSLRVGCLQCCLLYTSDAAD